MNLSERDANVICDRFTQQLPANKNISIVKGNGVLLYDENGKEYIDAVSSWWTNLFGHANAEIAAAISHQAQTLEHVIFAGFTHHPAIELAETLLQFLPV